MRRMVIIAAAALTLAAAPTLASAAPVPYTPPCTSNSDNCRQQRIVALEKKAAELEGRIKALEDAASPSPSPTTTTATPTVTPTATATATATATTTATSTPPPTTKTCAPGDPGYWTTTSSNNIGDGRTYGAYFVHNNMWNNHSGSGPPGTYTLTACAADNWSVDVTQQPSTVSPGAVRAYPNVHKDYNDAPLAAIQSARFAGEAPDCAGCIYNMAFDVWINNAFDNELMIWTQNKGQTPAGTRLSDADPVLAGSQATKNIGGKEYQVWKSGGLTSSGGIFTYVSVPAQTSGTMPLQLFFQDLQSRNWIPANSTTWQVDYGVETVSTAGVKQTFKFTDFAITES